jgi:hypothetical protein
MGIELVIPILAALISMLVGRWIPRLDVLKWLEIKVFQPQQRIPSYAERLSQLMRTLRESSSEVDAVLRELASVAVQRESAATKLEQELKDLETKEASLQQRIQDLQNVPIPVAKYFAELTEPGERRSARRDYMLFGAGVLVSTAISIVFFLVQGG